MYGNREKSREVCMRSDKAKRRFQSPDRPRRSPHAERGVQTTHNTPCHDGVSEGRVGTDYREDSGLKPADRTGIRVGDRSEPTTANTAD